MEDLSLEPQEELLAGLILSPLTAVTSPREPCALLKFLLMILTPNLLPPQEAKSRLCVSTGQSPCTLGAALTVAR